MRIITEPSVRVIARQTFDSNATGAYLDEFFPARPDEMNDGSSPDANEAEALVEFAGRTCYQSFGRPRPGGNRAYLEHILESGHGSVLEHASWSFLITGVSRSLTHELIRHRVGASISELSQRFVDMSEIGFVMPPAIQGGVDDQARKDWMYGIKIAKSVYGALAERIEATAPEDLSPTDRRKWARQAARSVLPECTETRIVWTANARALRHCIEMRTPPAADAEIKRLFLAVLKLMKSEAPHIFGDYDESGVTPWRKV